MPFGTSTRGVTIIGSKHRVKLCDVNMESTNTKLRVPYILSPHVYTYICICEHLSLHVNICTERERKGDRKEERKRERHS